MFALAAVLLLGGCAEKGYPMFYPGDSDKNLTEDSGTD